MAKAIHSFNGRLENGSVLGVDVGYSERRKTTCITLVTWDTCDIKFSSRLVGADSKERMNSIKDVVNNVHIAGIGIDGPLTHSLRHICNYRSAEAILSNGAFQQRGKPGQTSSGNGQKLHQQATSLAKLVLGTVQISNATHYKPIHVKRIVEAFPNAFLAALIPEDELPTVRGKASDRYWETAVEKKNYLEQLFNKLLPERTLLTNLKGVKNHEVRAGIICALTALTVVMGMHIGVGDHEDGYIILPPYDSWAEWMEKELSENVKKVRKRASHQNHCCSRQNHSNASLITNNGEWDQCKRILENRD